MNDSESTTSTDTPTIQFEQLGIRQPVLKLLSEIGYEAPSPIQEKSIPPLMEGRDLLGLAQTGTGKTAAFALPIISRLDLQLCQPQALVLVPTRELAIQVSEAFQKYATHIKDFHVVPIYGGQDMRGQLRQLQRGVHVVVGTPGRVMDHIRRRSLVLDQLTTLVLDEADEMLRMGFIEDVEWILEHTPNEKQVALFSATMPKAIKNISNHYLNNEVEVKIASKTATVERIQQLYLMINPHQKLEALTRVLEMEEFDGVIIFVRTKLATLELAQKLEARGYASAGLNGDMDQKQREMTIDRLRKGKIDIVIATDVAARGIDVTRVSHVVNFDLPYDSEAYVHRIGRTGRAGRSGRAILFVTPRERHMLRMIERSTRQPLESLQIPTYKQISAQRINTFKDSVLAVLSSDEEGRQVDIADYREIVDQLVLQTEASIEELAAGLLYLAQRDRPLFVPKNSALDDPKKAAQDRGNSSKRKGRDRKDERRGRDEPRRRSRGGSNDEGMGLYRLSVGQMDDVSPREIVGAIANEADIDSRHIGKIAIFDSYSTIELPKDLPKAALNTLKNTRVKRKRLQIERFKGERGEGREARSERGGERGNRGERGHRSDRGGRGEREYGRDFRAKDRKSDAGQNKKSRKKNVGRKSAAGGEPGKGAAREASETLTINHGKKQGNRKERRRHLQRAF